MARDVLIAAKKGEYKTADLPAILKADIAQDGNFDGGDRLIALKSSAHLLSSDQEVASITGHKSMQMLRRYTHLRTEDLVDKIKNI